MVSQFALLSIFALFIQLSMGQDGQIFCKTFVQCSQEADNILAQCEKMIQVPKMMKDSSNSSLNGTKSKSINADCRSNVNGISQHLVQKQNEQRQQQRGCLVRRSNESVMVGDMPMQKRCQKFVDDISSKKPQKRIFKRNAALMNETDLINASQGHTPGNPIPMTNFSANASVNQEIQEHQENKSISSHNGFINYAKCIDEAEAKERSCRALSYCCSEMETCDFEYKLSPLYAEIIQLQYDLFKQYRECRKHDKPMAEQKNRKRISKP